MKWKDKKKWIHILVIIDHIFHILKAISKKFKISRAVPHPC